MASEFCDWEPCTWLQKLFEGNIDNGDPKTISITVLPKNKKAKPRTLTLWYCPFCGTRVHDNREIHKWLDERRR